jgi:hypothetical protein
MDEQFPEHSVLGSKTTQFEHNLDEVESAESEPREVTEWDVAEICEYEWPHSIGGSQGEEQCEESWLNFDPAIKRADTMPCMWWRVPRFL